MNRLQSISSVPSASSAVSFAYDYNAANQRTRRIEADGSYWRYEYDRLGQVVSGKKFWSDWTPVAGQQFGYSFDDIGNRTQTLAGGDQNGGSLRPASYSANLLNQYTSRTVPGAADILGVALATSTVTVNSQAVYRKGEYFRKEVSVSNGSTPAWQGITVAASGQISATGNLFVPPSPEQFGYDDDGNLTQDGHWNYGWDAENRLVALTNRAAPAPAQLLRFEYDAKGRRIHKQVWNNTDGSGNPAIDIKFAYDGWNLLAELNPQNLALRTYLWGLDLSGTFQGAGGVGGLLAVKDAVNGTHFAAYDGNGDLSALVSASDGSVSALCEYGPFGEVIRATGPMAKANPFRFSTKYQDDETDLVYYGFRYCNASMGRWINRDPVGENGGANLYLFAENTPVNRVDRYGLISDETLNNKAEQGATCKYSVAFDLTPKSEFKGWRNKLGTLGSTFVSNSDDMLKYINSRVVNYDPEGKCCRGACIDRLVIAHHGNGAGVVVLSTDMSEGYSLLSDNAINGTLAEGKQLSGEQRRQQAQNDEALSALSQMAAKLCRNAKVSIVQCNSEFENDKYSLKARLQLVFGPDKQIETFRGLCGVKFGRATENVY